MPVSACVSSADANESRETSMSRFTVWFTSSREVAPTTHAQNCFGAFFEATMIVLAEWSSGTA